MIVKTLLPVGFLCLPLGILGVVYPTSQSQEIQLSAVLTQQRKTVSVVLRNSGMHSYLLNMGGHLGRFCGSAFRFAFQSEKTGQDTVQTSCGEAADDPGVIGGRFESWVIFLPPGASYGMTFQLNEMRLTHNMHTNLAGLINKDWRLDVHYVGSLDENYVAEWQFFHKNAPPSSAWSKQVPFWTGTAQAAILNAN